jgi:hypothetical protein
MTDPTDALRLLRGLPAAVSIVVAFALISNGDKATVLFVVVACCVKLSIDWMCETPETFE